MPCIPTAKQITDARLPLSMAYSFSTAVFFMNEVAPLIYVEAHINNVVIELSKAAALLGYDLVEKPTVLLPEHETRQ